MSDWLQTLQQLTGAGRCCVVVTVAHTEGSVPREAGTKMVVTPESAFGTIGGGHLEWKAMELARGMLSACGAAVAFYRFPLGPSLGQCCGGVASLVMERLAGAQPWVAELQALSAAGVPALLVTPRCEETTAPGRRVLPLAEALDTRTAAIDPALRVAAESLKTRSNSTGGGDPAPTAMMVSDGKEFSALLELVAADPFDIVLFGAGHVGRAAVEILQRLPCRLTWIDGRYGQLPASGPTNVNLIASDCPADEVDDAPTNAYYLVMTHSHALDQDICDRILRRGDFAYLGLIGSKTKRALFERRLKARGLSPAQLQRLTCPIGVPGITGKEPAVIAVSLAAQILQWRERSMRSAYDGCEEGAAARRPAVERPEREETLRASRDRV
jgi:xanthine dehydrogenase accessory factor